MNPGYQQMIFVQGFSYSASIAASGWIWLSKIQVLTFLPIIEAGTTAAELGSLPAVWLSRVGEVCEAFAKGYPHICFSQELGNC